MGVFESVFGTCFSLKILSKPSSFELNGRVVVKISQLNNKYLSGKELNSRDGCGDQSSYVIVLCLGTNGGLQKS